MLFNDLHSQLNANITSFIDLIFWTLWFAWIFSWSVIMSKNSTDLHDEWFRDRCDTVKCFLWCSLQNFCHATYQHTSKIPKKTFCWEKNGAEILSHIGGHVRKSETSQFHMRRTLCDSRFVGQVSFPTTKYYLSTYTNAKVLP